MSSVNWSKIRTASEAKAKIAHNAKETRLERNHSNPHIDKSKIHLNLNFDGRTYRQRCKAYDDRVSFCKGNMKRVRSDAITMIGLNVKIPENLTHADYALQAEWCRDAYQIIRDFVGKENVVSATADFDEVHEYFDPDLKKMVLSRPEVDVKFVPEVNGKLSAKAWQTKGTMTKLNNQIEQMTEQKYHMTFLTGKGGKNLSAEELKAQSIIAEAEYNAEQILKEAEREADEIFESASDKIAEASDEVDRRAKAVMAREREVASKERNIAIKERFLDSKGKTMAEKEKVLQDDTEAMEHYRSMLHDWEAELNERSKTINEMTPLDDVLKDVISHAYVRVRGSDGATKAVPVMEYIERQKKKRAEAVRSRRPLPFVRDNGQENEDEYER